MSTEKIRYAVVGLGHIAQNVVLPAFEHASENSVLTALISDDAEKIGELSHRYKVPYCYTYEKFEEALAEDTFDAVYIALPNDKHKEFAIMAANAGVNVLCEKPMAVSSGDCHDMIAAAEHNKIKLMIAYRLHFERTNMEAVKAIKSGAIGVPRLLNASFTMQVAPNNIRTHVAQAGGPLYDIGIYCINAARYLFQAEPSSAMAIFARGEDPRFSEVEESVAAILKFPGERLASFVCSFGASPVARCEVLGTTGTIALDPAFDYEGELKLEVKPKDEEPEETLATKSDQFAAELSYFSKCILEDTNPRPSGYEGLADIRIIEAIIQSAESGKKVDLKLRGDKSSLPDDSLVMQFQPITPPPLVNAEPPSQ
jgi:glucose-fructose oxidoreductase